jgi:hypothetical protein
MKTVRANMLLDVEYKFDSDKFDEESLREVVELTLEQNDISVNSCDLADGYMTEQQAIKTLTVADWTEVVYEEIKKGKDYVFEKNNRFVVVDKGFFTQIGSQNISANELDALATLCKLTERMEE